MSTVAPNSPTDTARALRVAVERSLPPALADLLLPMLLMLDVVRQAADDQAAVRAANDTFARVQAEADGHALLAAYRELLAGVPAALPGKPARAPECDVCGAADGAFVPMIHAVNHGRISAHQDCGEHRGYVLDVAPAAPAL